MNRSVARSLSPLSHFFVTGLREVGTVFSQFIAEIEKYCGTRATAWFVRLAFLGAATLLLNLITTNALEMTLRTLILQAGVTITGMKADTVKTILILAWSVLSVQWVTIIVLLLIQFVTGRPKRTITPPPDEPPST